MQVTIHSSASIFETLHPEWNPLLGQSITNSFFLTWEFQKTWWDHFGGGQHLQVVSARDEAGRLIGLAPLYLTHSEGEAHHLRIIGGIDVADYLDWLALRGQEQAILAALFAAICDQTPYPWTLLDLRPLPAATPTRALLPALAEARGFHVAACLSDVCPIIELPPTFEAYLESLDKKQRHELRRKMRKAHSDADVRWHVVGADHDLARAMDDFIALHQSSSAGKDDFMTPLMKDFFQALARAAYDAGWLELAFVEFNGRPAATYLNFAYDRNTLVYNSGFDPQAYSLLSPGIVLLTHLIERAIQNGHQRFDFLRGDEVYKFRMGAKPTEVHQLAISRT
ncbi:MAG: GNAT family N-acetyltransferase [Chloroflexi bacterium]|nr:GNAT family N-acetyltransferase [Chloroflexota bacterium]